jgi:hypothetical protein
MYDDVERTQGPGKAKEKLLQLQLLLAINLPSAKYTDLQILPAKTDRYFP